MAISHFRHKLGIKFVCTGQTLLRNKYLEIFDSILLFFFAEFVHLAHWPLTASPDYLLICLTVNLAWCYAFKSAKVRHYWFHLGHQLFRKKSSLWKRLLKKIIIKNSTIILIPSLNPEVHYGKYVLCSDFQSFFAFSTSTLLLTLHSFGRKTFSGLCR